MLSPDDVPGIGTVSIDGSAIGVALLLAATTGTLAGAVPAAVLTRASELRVVAGGFPSRPRVGPSCQPDTRGGGGRALVGAARRSDVMVQSFIRLSRVELGFDPDQLLAVEVPLSADRYPEVSQRRAFFASLVERISAWPEVEGAATVLVRPLRGPEGYNWPVTIEGQSDERGH